MGGFVDGEGTITICSNAKHRRYVPKIAVANTNKEAVAIFVKEFGGKVRLRTWAKNKNWKPCYEWSLSNRQALKAIEVLYPYLAIKHKQAKIVLKVKQIRIYNAAELRWNSSLKTEVYNKLDKLKCKVQNLNKRGLHD